MSTTQAASGWPGRRPPALLLYAVTLTGITANTLVSPVLPDLIAYFDQPDSAAGLVVASASMPGFFAAPVIGITADRIGRRRVLVPCLALFGVMSAVLVSAQAFWVVVGARFLMGFGSAGLINLAIVIIGDHWTGEERVRQVGRNAAVLTSSLAILPLLSGLLATVGTWRLALSPSVLSVITAVFAYRLLDDVRPPHGDLSVGEQLRSAGKTIKTPVIAATMLSGFLIFVMIFGLFLTTLPIHLADEFGLQAASRGLLLALPSISSTLIALNITSLRRRLGLRTILVAGAGMFGVALLLAGWAAAIWGVVIGLLVYGLAEGFTVPSLQEVTAARAPSEQRGTVLAAWVSAVRLGQATGPLVFSALFAAVGTGNTLMIGALVCVPLMALHAFTQISTEPDSPEDVEPDF